MRSQPNYFEFFSGVVVIDVFIVFVADNTWSIKVQLALLEALSNSSLYSPSLVFRPGVDFVLPPTKIYQKEVYYGLEI